MMEKFNSLTQTEMALWIAISFLVLYLVSLVIRSLHKPKLYKIDNVDHIEFRGPRGEPTLSARTNHDHLSIKDDRQIYNEENKYDS